MSRSTSRTSVLMAASCIMVLAAAPPVAASTPPASVLVEAPAFPYETEEPVGTLERTNNDAERCALDVGAPTLRERFVEWWRQNRALSWLSRAVHVEETASSRRPPASYHLRSPLLSGLIVEPASPRCKIAAEPERIDSVKAPPAIACRDKAKCGTGPRRGPTL